MQKSQVRIEAASDRDVAQIEALLTKRGLPTAGLRDQFPAAYVLAVDVGIVVGCAGLEAYRDVGLLRSCAVSARHEGRGIGRALVANRIEAARAQKLEAVYLLTTTASDYFVQLGFASAARAAVPMRLAASPEFAGACPATASCLSLVL